jgi:hypothetical protein
VRWMVWLLLLPLIAGCGSSDSGHAPASLHDARSGMDVRVDRVASGSMAAFLLVSLVNNGSRAYQGGSDFEAAMGAGHAARSACLADSTHGSPLDESGVPPGATRSGWILCPLVRHGKLFHLLWHGHTVGTLTVG